MHLKRYVVFLFDKDKYFFQLRPIYAHTSQVRVSYWSILSYSLYGKWILFTTPSLFTDIEVAYGSYKSA